MFFFLIKWIINAFVLIATAHLVRGIHINSFKAAMVAALVLGLVNTFVRPFFLFITLPINIMTLGLFTLIINGLMLWFTSSLVAGFAIENFISACIAALVVTIISVLLSIVG